MAINAKRLTRYFFMMIVVVSVFMINTGRPQALHNNYINYYGIEMTDDEYLTLVNLGFTDLEIQYMTKETFEENKDLDATLVATGRKYLKITYPIYGVPYVTELSELQFLQQTANQANAPLGQVITQFLQEISTISQNGSKYRYKDSVNWFTMPSEHYYDVMGIGFVNSVKIDSSVYFNYIYETPDISYTTSTLYYDKKSTSTGGTTVYKIPNNIVMLSSNIFFDVIKNTTDTLYGLEMCGDYAHALSSVTASQAASHGIGSLGIDFDASVYNYFNQIPCADAIANVVW